MKGCALLITLATSTLFLVAMSKHTIQFLVLLACIRQPPYRGLGPCSVYNCIYTSTITHWSMKAAIAPLHLTATALTSMLTIPNLLPAAQQLVIPTCQ